MRFPSDFPDFLLTTSLELDNTKMSDARAIGLPVVLLSL